MSDDPINSAALKEAIGKIWARELNLESVHGNDDFFGIGGDSISMLNVIFKIKEQLNIQVEPGTLFENPTLNQFVEALVGE